MLERLSLALCLLLVLAACGGESEVEPAPPGPAPAPALEGHALLGEDADAVVSGSEDLEASATAAAKEAVAAVGAAEATDLATLTVDYPHDGSIFPPDIVPPTFLWHDDADAVDSWLVEMRFSDDPGADATLRVLVAGPPPPEGRIDPRTLGPTNEVYRPTPYQATARSWTPSDALWAEIKRRSIETRADVRFVGFAAAQPATPLSEGRVTLRTSRDPVGAPIFYRDVPLMPGRGNKGRIQPLTKNIIPLIEWRLRDVSRPDSRIVLTDMPSCANCHSFSNDGETMGMDVDGPDGDKGAYMVAPIEEEMVVDTDDVLTWNSFPGKQEGHKTIGFLSRVSPDGRWVTSTVNEALFVQNFLDYKYLQVFFPTRGILAYYDTENETMQALPGADDPAYVHCGATWSPDGSYLVYCRAPAQDPYAPGQEMPEYPNDPKETQIQYDIVRIGFAEGRGGVAVPVEGASNNGMSNTFPKISPDGKWLVYTKCKNGLLMRPDGRLWIVPAEGGEAREMRCNTDNMNSWHTWSPNGRWLAFTSKSNTPYTQLFLTHVDEEGNDSPAILLPNCTAANRAVNLPEFLNADYDALQGIQVPAAKHHEYHWRGTQLLAEDHLEEAIVQFRRALEVDPDFSRAHGDLGVALGRVGRPQEAIPHFRRAVELNPDDTKALRNLALALEEGGDLAGAIEMLRRVLRVDGDLVAARTSLGDLLLRTGQARLGVLELERAVGEVSDDVRTLSLIAWHRATSPDTNVRKGGRALEYATRAVAASQRKRPEPLDALAAAYATLGRYEEAERAASEALDLLRGTTSPLAAELEARRRLYASGRAYVAGASGR